MSESELNITPSENCIIEPQIDIFVEAINNRDIKNIENLINENKKKIIKTLISFLKYTKKIYFLLKN